MLVIYFVNIEFFVKKKFEKLKFMKTLIMTNWMQLHVAFLLLKL